MFLCKTKILILCIGLLCVQGQVSLPPQPPASTTVVPPTSTSTTPKSTTITTSTTTTTTTTIKPTTTTTTTSKPTSTSTTTQKPTTPTTAQPTTTVKPTPVPDAKPGTWSSNYTDTNRTCMVVHMAIQVEIPATQKINLPFNATSVGQCGSSPSGREILTLTWDLGNNITLLFDKTNTSKFELSDLWVTLNTTNNTVHHYEYNKTLLEAPLENSYKCAKHQTFNLTCLDDAKQMAFLHISDVQMQAFRNVTGNNFDTALDCEGTSSRDVVPIVVGCVLAALVVLVLVGYLFGRRRCQARGYLSM